MSRITQKMYKSKLVALSSELPKDYVLSHYNSGNMYYLEITSEQDGHINIVSSYAGTISETYHTLRVLYDVVRYINLGHSIGREFNQ